MKEKCVVIDWAGELKVFSLVELLTTERGKQLLSVAYNEKHQVMCSCMGDSIEDYIPMHIMKRRKTLTIRRNPGTNALHHPECPKHSDIVTVEEKNNNTVGRLRESDNCTILELNIPNIFETEKKTPSLSVKHEENAAIPSSRDHYSEPKKYTVIYSLGENLLCWAWNKLMLSGDSRKFLPKAGNVFYYIMTHSNAYFINAFSLAEVMFFIKKLSTEINIQKDALRACSSVYFSGKNKYQKGMNMYVLGKVKESNVLNDKYVSLTVQELVKKKHFYINMRKTDYDRLEGRLHLNNEGVEKYISALVRRYKKDEIDILFMVKGAFLEIVPGRAIPVESQSEYEMVKFFLETGLNFLRNPRSSAEEHQRPNYYLLDDNLQIRLGICDNTEDYNSLEQHLCPVFLWNDQLKMKLQSGELPANNA